MKTFKEFRGNTPTQLVEQVYFKVSIPDLSPMFMKASSESAVKLDMRMKLKPDVVKEISIKRVTKSEMRKIYRAMGQGKEPEPDEKEKKEKEPTEEGFLDVFSKKGREKRAKEKGEKQARDAKSEKEKAEIKRMDTLQSKGAGQHTLSPDEKSELSRLRSKYSDVVKRREEKHRSSGPR